MAPPLKVTIAEPCNEDWSQMTPNQQGAFCKACQKTVVDFTGKTQTQIYDALAGQQQNVCGRFYNWQIAEPVVKTTINRSVFNWKAIAASLAALIAAENTSDAFDMDTHPKVEQHDTAAANLKIIDTAALQIKTIRADIKAEPVVGNDSCMDDKVYEIVWPRVSGETICTVMGGFSIINRPVAADSVHVKGKIIDSKTNQQIPYATISFNGKPIAVADDNGRFKLDLSADAKDGFIEVSYVGYQRKHILVADLKPNRNTVRMIEMKHVMMGEVSF